MANYAPIRLRDIPVRERPASRVARQGADSVSLAELLAAVIGGERQVEAAHALLAKYGSLTALAQADIQDLSRVNGVGPSRAAALQAALALGARLVGEHEDRALVNSPAAAAKVLFAQSFAREVEHFWVLLLDQRQRLIETELLYRGMVAGIQVRPAEVYREAVRRNASAIVVAHNHPSGDPRPSKEDVALTLDIWKAGKVLHVEFLDHIVLGSGGTFISLAETLDELTP